MAARMVGERLSGRYELLRELGRGGMGVVYLARDHALEREVAIKLLPPHVLSADAVDRFRREARVVAKMEHPGVVGIHDIAEHEGATYLVMPFVPGITLRAAIDAGPLSLDEALDLGAQVADALAYSHARGIIHRDIKPENIMVERTDPGRSRARVLDFGIATAIHEERLTRSGQLVGTAAYLSPEQVDGAEADERSDLYALGAVLHECLTGRMVFAGRPPAVLHRIVFEPAPPIRESRSDVDPGLDAFVLQCLEKRPELRPQRARAVAAQLESYREALLTDDAIRARVVTTLSVPRRRPTRAAFIGRESELREITRRLTSAASGDCQLVLVSGEAGTGKSRLLEEAEAIARGRGLRVLHGRFLERDQSFPYQGFCDVFHEHFRLAPTDDASAPGELGSLAEELSQLFPGLGEAEPARTTLVPRVPSHAAYADRSAVFELLARALARIAAARPLAVFFEELHSADVSVDALRFATRRLSAVPIAFVGTYRPSELTPEHSLSRLVADFRRERRFALVHLNAFSASETRSFASSLLAGEVAERLARMVHEAAEGNPYFVRELLRSLVDGGNVACAASGQWDLRGEANVAPDDLPETIQQAVGERIARIDPADADLLSTASILGREFATGELSGLAVHATELDECLDRLVEKGFLVERGAGGERMAFASGVLRDVLYARLSRRRRRNLHAAHARLLETSNAGRLERVAAHLHHHWSAAGERQRALEFALVAARFALDARATEDALRSARHAVDAIQADESLERFEGEARSLLAAALRLGGQTESALREIASAVAAYERRGGAIDALAAMTFAAETSWEARDVERTRSWVERGLDAARRIPRVDSGAYRARLLTLGATAANLRGDYERAASMLEEATDLEDALERPSASLRLSRGRSGHLRVPFLPELATLDPTIPTTNVALEALSTVFETLTRTGEGARIEPWLAESFTPEAGGSRYRFRLRPGVRFHDGRPLTSDDVGSSFARLVASRESANGWALAPVRGAAAVASGSASRLAGFVVYSDLEFTIELERPMAFFPALLTFLPAAILPAGTSTVGASWRDGCVGTGPFRVTRFEPGRSLELEANPDYWRPGLPRTEDLVFTFGVPPDVVRSGFVEGHYSLARGLAVADVELLRRDPDIAVGYHETPQLTTTFLALNAASGGMAAIENRRRIAGALDTAELVGVALGRSGIAANGLVPPGLLGYEPPRRVTAPVLVHNTGTVGEELALRGIALRSFVEGHYAKLTHELVDSLAREGIRLRIEDLTQAEADEARAGGYAEVCLWGWVADYPDADTFYHGVLHSETGIVGRFCGSAEIDALIERGRAETDPAARHRVYREIEAAISERVLLIPISHPLVSCFARPEVGGLDLNAATPLISYERLWFRR